LSNSPTIEASHSIFRSKAVEQYRQSREKDILPRFVAPPVFLALWVLLGLLLAGVMTAWLGQMPTYVAGTGVVLNASAPAGEHTGQQSIALIFIPTNPGQPLRIVPGMPVSLQVSSQGQTINANIDSIEPGVISPGDAQRRYALGSDCTQIISEPSIAVIARLASTFPVQTYTGSSLTARVQIGSQSVLSLLPGLGPFIGA
jgi:hypothetical protein